MKNRVVVVGAGEMGGVFARGFLKLGYPVVPITRDMDLPGELKQLYYVTSLIVAVGEKDLDEVLEQIPKNFHDRIVLLQNELLPEDWQKHQIPNPTVISVWFEKKQPQDFKVLIPSPVYGPQAKLVGDALAALNIPTKACSSENDLLFELVLKNLYILTVNIAGLQVGGTVEELWKKHEDLARAVADDVLNIQFAMIGKELDRKKLMEGLLKAFEGDWQHKCMGRSAPDRLERALEIAQKNDIAVPQLEKIKSAV
ncbi:MAG: hypothetical protein KC713_00235 [Candidatus Omnitrophica bacterium]|nr:hypothetical protein [Candidatus Omnitrophota bacterium]